VADVNYWTLKEQKFVFEGSQAFFMIERRREPRIQANLSVRIWGVDIQGRPFQQEVVATNISSRGALLSNVDQKIKCEDLIGLVYGEKKARFRVVWIRDSGTGQKMQVAVQRLEHEKCPWNEMLSPEGKREHDPVGEPDRADLPESVQAGDGDNGSGRTITRRWHRHKLDVPLRVIVHRRGKSSIFVGRGNEVSEGGMALTAGVELKPGDEVDIEFTPAYSAPPIRTTGKVCNRAGYRYGVEFLRRDALEIEQCDQLKAMFESMSSKASAEVSEQPAPSP
jgi:hypothetical protein